jgi:hypothetical protein
MKRAYIDLLSRQNSLLLVIFASALLLFSVIDLSAQEPPPVVDATVSQILSFGAFTSSPGIGHVSISPGGVRTTDNVVPLGGFPSNAVINVTTNRPALLSMLIGSNIKLIHISGKFMTLHIEDTDIDPPSPFIVQHPPGNVEVKFGGTLDVGDIGSNPAGDYSGTFDVTFIWE